MVRLARLGVLLLLLALNVLALHAGPARADVVEDAFNALASQNFDDIRRGVDLLATSGHPQASTFIAAIQAGQFLVRPDGAMRLRQADNKIIDPRTGQPAELGSGTRPVRLNNALRRAIEAALGALRLFAPDAPTRRAAAEAVFVSRDPAALPALAQALAKETDTGVLRALREAQAAALSSLPDSREPDRIAAIAVLRARGDLSAQSMLGSLRGQPPAVAEAAAAALKAIAFSQLLWGQAQAVYYGLSLGSVLLLAAAGLAITFGVMGVINMAHGEMVMIGAYVTFVVQDVIRASAPGLFGASLLIAVPLAFAITGLIGIAIERGLIRFLYGRPLETLLATWGLSLALQQAVRSIFGPTNREVGTPQWMSGAAEVGGLVITYNRLAIIVFALGVLFALMAALRYTALGLRMRAVTQNRQMAGAMGIHTPRIDALTFGLGSGVAGIAGVALSQIDNVSPNLGQGYIIDSFMVVVFGGVGNLWGTALAALTLGIVNKFLEPVAGAVLGKILVLILLILFIQRRPRGLFPLKGRAVEA